jgi:O-6-methylguanine DNA methyltransferase
MLFFENTLHKVIEVEIVKMRSSVNYDGGGSRAVSNAMAHNPFPLLIPCHRVVRADFNVGGYGSGEKIKLELLQREERGYEEDRRVKINGETLLLFPVKRLQKD